MESIAFTVNGTKHMLTSNVSERAVLYDAITKFSATTILASSLQNKESMGMQILYKGSLKIGTYTLSNDPGLDSGNITFTYEDDNGYTYIQDFTYPDQKITITEIGADYIKGTFSAKLSAILPSGSQPVPDITMTDGDFYAKAVPVN